MLFQSQVPVLFQNLKIDLYNADNQRRKEEAAKRLNFYHDSQLARLEEQLDILFAEPSKMVKLELNITKKIINNLAQIYRVPPTREIEGRASDKKIYKKIVAGAMFDVKMKQAPRYTKLLKSLLFATYRLHSISFGGRY